MDKQSEKVFDESRISLALSYENNDIVEKFSREYKMDYGLANEYFYELKKYLFLCSVTNQKLAPSPEIDKIWHTFILFTKEYRNYCLNFLGRFIDHAPEVKKAISKENYLQNTITEYEYVFGQLNNAIWQVQENRADFQEDDLNLNTERRSNCDTGWDSAKKSCVFTGDCYSCTNSRGSCVGENPNDL